MSNNVVWVSQFSMNNTGFQSFWASAQKLPSVNLHHCQATHLVFTQIFGFYEEPPGGNEGSPGDMNWFWCDMCFLVFLQYVWMY